MAIHGIAVREKKTKKLIHFVPCSIASALKVLSGIRRNMADRYEAQEDMIEEKEIQAIGGFNGI